MKRILLTTAFTLLCIVSTWAAGFTATTDEGYELKYNVNPDGYTVTLIGLADGASAGAADLVIPATVTNAKDYSVTAIAECAFDGCSGFTGSLTIPNSVDSIGNAAFSGCDKLTTVILPKGLTKINNSLFEDCTSIENITFPDNVTKIGGRSAFSDTKWFANQPDGVLYIGKCLYAYKGTMPANTKIAVTEGTTQICGDAFKNQTNLLAITLPKSLTRISSYAFEGATALAEVTMLGATAPFVSNDDGAFGNIAAGAKVYVPAEGIGTEENQYGTEGGTWQGLTIVKAVVSVGIDQEHAAVPFTRMQNTLYFAQPTAVAVYSVSGVMLFYGIVSEYQFQVKGVYVVATANGSHKVIVNLN